MNKVLVIDDDDLVLRSVASILKRQGYEFKLAQSAQQAIDFAAQEEFDIVLSDIRMPTINGVDAVKKIQEDREKAQKKDLPIIFITGFAEDSIQLSAGHFGEIIQKPFDLDQLMTTMREYL